MKQHIIQFFYFLEKKENRQIPLKAKLLNPKDFEIGPEDLNVKRGLNLTYNRIKSLPDNLTVRGTLWLGNTPIESLPDNLTVKGALILNRTVIDSIPDNLKVDGILRIWDTPLAEKYTKEEIRSMIEKKGGYIKGKIYKK